MKGARTMAGEKKTLAIISLITGILGFLGAICVAGGLPGIAAIICGVLSKKKMEGGTGMSTAGIILGALGILGSIIALIVFIVSGNAFFEGFWEGFNDSYY
jgi:hypothetical protein